MKKEIKVMDNGLTYEKNGAYWIPVVELPAQPEGWIGKYGMLRRDFMKEHRQGIYQNLVMDGELKRYLMDIDQQCKYQVEQILLSLQKSWNITEELKAQDQLEWVGMMNNAQASAEEIVMKEIIYK